MSDTVRYTHGHHESVLRSHIWRTAENSAAYLLPHLTRGISLLDVGCGPATITCDLAERVAPGKVTGVDSAQAALESARATATGRGIQNVSFEPADVVSLPYGDDTFDVVHCHQVLQHLRDPVAALAEMRRVCRPAGLVAAREADYPAKMWYPEDDSMRRWMDLYLLVAASNNAQPDAGRKLMSWAQQAGFVKVSPSASVWCFATPQDRAWWGGLWADRVTKSAFADQALAGGLATREELEEMSAAWRRWADAEDGWYVVVHGEVICSP